MGATTAIEWTDATWNPVRARNNATGKLGSHCEHVSEGCRYCYAEGINRRLGTGLPFKPGHRDDVALFLDETKLGAPLRWRAPRMIFLLSMSDLFADFVADEWILRILDVVRRCSYDGGSSRGRIGGGAGQHVFQVLTKRAARMRAFMRRLRYNPDAGKDQVALYLADDDRRPMVLGNLWLGISAEDQPSFDDRYPFLRDTPAARRFVSFEPLLGPIDASWWLSGQICRGCGRFQRHIGACDACGFRVWRLAIDWAIVGGESGPQARPMNPNWARALRDQCQAGRVPFFFKQWGEWGPGECARGNPTRTERTATWWNDRWNYSHLTMTESEGLHRDDEPDLYRLGKKRIYHVLDGREWHEFPSVASVPSVLNSEAVAPPAPSPEPSPRGGEGVEP